jgi:two-component system sensor histidine kinase KdpD
LSQSRQSDFLHLIRRAERGRLKIYLGYAPGVGKTCAMLEEGHRLRREGLEVVVGLVEAHGRPHTRRLLEGLEVQAPAEFRYHGAASQELDLDGLLKRRPQVVLIDELAHSNPPGSRNAKRYQDVQELRAAGVHVISTLNVQHLESLFDAVERMTGVKVRERLPDLALSDSDEVVNVDLAVDDLLRRVVDGQVLPAESVDQALKSFFKPDSLEQLRELALRELASRIDVRRRESSPDPGWSEQFLVALGPRPDTHPALLRYASRLAGRLNRNWYAVHVHTPELAAESDPQAAKNRLARTMDLANQLGAVVFTVKGEDPVEALLDFARRYRVGNLVVGKPRRPRGLPWFGRQRVVERLLAVKGLTVQVVDGADPADAHSAAASAASGPSGAPRRVPETPADPGLLAAAQVLVLDEPVGHQQLIRILVRMALKGSGVSPLDAGDAVLERERKGSTFLNSGLAVPHAMIPGLPGPRLALCLPKAGVSDPRETVPVDAVFLLLTPAGAETQHLELLSAIGRAFQDAAVREALRRAGSPEDAIEALHGTRLVSPAPPGPPRP